MVMDKRKKVSGNYTYGNVAYNLQPERQPDVRCVKKAKVVKSKKAKKALKVKLKLMRSVAIFGVITFLILCRTAKINSLTADVRSIKKDITNIQKENANLEVKIASACNLKSIEETATNTYEMVDPTSDNVEYIQVEELAQVQEEEEESTKAGFDIKKLFGFND